MQKERLLLLIDNLRKGGAEVLLVGILKDLSEHYDIILVTLSDGCDFPAESIICKEKYRLGFTGKFSLLTTVWKLKKIIRKTSPAIIHAHLFYSSLVARLACPSSIPLFYSLHNELSKNIFDKQPWLGTLEKLTIRKNHAVIAVSDLVLEDYERTIKLTKLHYVLKNYIADEFFTTGSPVVNMVQRPAKFIAVGNIKEQKNYGYLLQTMAKLKHLDITLDIYGKKDERLYPALQAFIDKENLPVKFKGPADNMHLLYPQYDLFLMASTYEGFGLVVVEAMAAGLPLVLSNIPVFREVTKGNAQFFDLESPNSLALLVEKLVTTHSCLQPLTDNGKAIAHSYTKQKYLTGLLNIYSETRP